MKNIILITGGCGFIGTNLIELLLQKTKKNIISLDDYSSGSKKNHISHKRVKYIKGHTKDIELRLRKYKEKIDCIFHFGEFSRIYQSFLKMDQCIKSNTIGSNAVFNFCLKNKIRIIYSATSASLGNSGNDKNLSPYAFTKSKNIEFLENLKKWFSFRYDVIFFYNVYGPKQICKGEMATVIGIFEDHYARNKPLPIVRPGTQSRRFTHIYDTVEACYYAWKKDKCRYYSVTNRLSYSILDVAKMFDTKIKLMPFREGERYASALTNISSNNKIQRIFGKLNLKDHIVNFTKKFQ